MSSLSIKIGAILDSSFSSTMVGSNAQLSRLGSTMRQLKESMKPGSKLNDLINGMMAARNSWRSSRTEVKNLTAEIAKMEKPSKVLQNKLDKARKSVSKARVGCLKKVEALRTLREELKKSGVDIQSVVSNHSKLETSLSRVSNQYKMLNSVVRAHGEAKTSRSAYKSEMFDTAALGMTAITPIKVAIDFESFFADVTKVVEFKSDEEAKEFADNLKKMSRTIPLSAAELAQIAASGGQLGIAKEKLLKFTEIVAKMSTAFDITAGEAGDAIAKLANVYGIEVEDMTDTGDAFNYLSDNTAAKAKDMIPVVNRMGGVAKQFGLTIEQASALANTFIALGVPVSKSGTAAVALLTGLLIAEQQDEKFQDTLEEIGTSAEEIKQGIKDDPIGTLLNFLELLEKVEKQEQSGILVNLYGKEFQDEIALLVGSLDQFRENLALLAKEERKGSMQREFDNRASTTANKLQLLKNSIAEVGMNLGSVMLPTLKSIAEWLQKKAQYVALLIEEYPTITKVIMSTISVLISLKIAIVALGYGWSFLAGAVLGIATKTLTVFSFLSVYAIPAVITGLSVLKATTLSLATRAFPLLSSALPAVAAGLRAMALAAISNPISFLSTYVIPAVIARLSVLKAITLSLAMRAFPMLSSVLPAVAAGVRFLTAAIVTNPVGSIIALLASGAILVISNWEKVKSFFASFWEYIKSIIKPIGEAFSWMGSTVGSIFGKVTENSPLKEFEQRESIATKMHTPLKNSISNNENSLLNNSAIKELSEKSKNNVKIKSFIEESKSIENTKVEKVLKKNSFEKKESKICNQTFHQTFNINVKAEPHQDVRSIADAVIERFREQARGALFDIVEPVS